ncbi:NAD(+)--dinitrogen-reductase ADP-D-ribosyltransferase [Caldimonas tepidiphila]|uniref:NAD(+)--dinitrogen-reductase ADP-D-ribosyltransferase n=1 Tax=Caldimonas tepidiphila TaxID=2315841 RepID=UPI00196A6573|nr:NAD(+)--dinitrogen-reductase ADP-D-ribosyltransferase [Caldimonas tepidiphila]
MSGGDAPGPPPERHGTNLVGVPAALIGSAVFNAHPVRLRIHGTRESARGLFHLLDTAGSPAEAGAMFRHFMSLRFGLQPDPAARQRAERLRWRSSYLRLLEGWGFDSNSPAASVLKGWVESRFGLVPSFHGAPLDLFPSPAWVAYIESKMHSRFHNNCINQQLDLLYEFCQWSVRRFGLPARGRIPVWRGVNGLAEHRLREGSLRARDCVLYLNNLVSFSLTRERAESFGDWVLATEVPVQKLLFFPGLLGPSLLAGEGEVIALGGDYRVQASYW